MMNKRFGAQYRICFNCGKILEEKYFFAFKNEITDCVCKECRLEGRSDRFPSDYYSLFKLYDIPYIRDEWESLVDRHIKACVIENKPYKSIFGKYLTKMKLKGYKHYTWKDSEYLSHINVD